MNSPSRRAKNVRANVRLGVPAKQIAYAVEIIEWHVTVACTVGQQNRQRRRAERPYGCKGNSGHFTVRYETYGVDGIFR